METLYDLKEIAKYLRRSELSVRRLVWEKKIPFYKIGGKILFKETDIEKWLEKKKKGEKQ